MTIYCELKKIISAVTTREGAGFEVQRAFPTQHLSEWDPILLIDEHGPVDCAPNEAIGAPAHPHRGFETISYLLEGHIIHRDSLGNIGELKSGGVQWVQAGSGMVHEELPHPDFLTRGGRMHGFQVWLNLPPKFKMSPPNCEHFTSEQIPVCTLSNQSGTVKVIAGAFLNMYGPVDTRSNVQLYDITLKEKTDIIIPTATHSRSMLYLYQGQAQLGSHSITSRQLAVFEAGEAVQINASSRQPMRALFFSGLPYNAPIARYGPFVMNNHIELADAFADYQAGKMGTLD